MPKASPETNEDATLPVAESSPVDYKKMVLILLAAVVFGLGIGGVAALTLKKFTAPPMPAAPEPAPGLGAAAPTPAPAPAAKPLESAAPVPVSAPAAATTPDEGATPPMASEPPAAPASSAGSAPIPVLTGAEIKERYNISRFVDVETNQLCYLAEPRSPGSTGALDCEPRPAHVSGKRDE